MNSSVLSAAHQNFDLSTTRPPPDSQYCGYAFINILVPTGGQPLIAMVQQKRQDFLMNHMLKAQETEEGFNYDPNGPKDDPEECCDF